MNQGPINAFFFPTQVLFVDDDLNYINSIISLLNSQTASFKMTGNPVEASDYLLNTYQPTQFLQHAISRPETGINQTRVDIDIQEIVKVIYNNKRFSEISVMVTDFNMPQQTGQQLCEKLKASPIKKLMITSEADENLAINLLNKSIINKFVKKLRATRSEITFIDNLQEMINELQESYFNKQSNDIMKNMISSDEDTASCVNNIDFIQLFKKIVHENKICEYYLIDSTGSFLLITPSGKQSYLLVQSPDDIRTAIELTECSDTPNLEVLAALKSGERMLYWSMDNGFPLTAEDQLAHSHPAVKLGKYYYSYVKGQNILGLDQTKILSFNQYIKSNNHL